MFLVQTKFDSSVYNGIESIEANFYIALNISDYVKKKKRASRQFSPCFGEPSCFRKLSLISGYKGNNSINSIEVSCGMFDFSVSDVVSWLESQGLRDLRVVIEGKSSC